MGSCVGWIMTTYNIHAQLAPDDRIIYYLQDSTSIAQVGRIEQWVHFSEIAPISNTTSDIRNASNALYDAALEWLKKRKASQRRYQVTLVDANSPPTIGDKVKLSYRMVDPDISIDDTLWITGIDENIGANGIITTLTVSSTDIRPPSADELVVRNLEQVRLKNFQPPTGNSADTRIYRDSIDTLNPVTIPLEITDSTLELQRLRLRIQTSPMKIDIERASPGGDHDHRMLKVGATFSNNLSTQQNTQARNSAGTEVTVPLELGGGSGLSGDIYTYDSSGDHTHDLVFGVKEDTVRPSSITVQVNDTDLTANLFGQNTLAVDGAALDVVADAGVLTNAILGASSLYGTHTIKISCGSGRGNVTATLDIFQSIQGIQLG